MSDDVPSTNKPSLADDLVRGAANIGREYNREPAGVYYDARTGRMPIGRDGKELIAFRSQLRQHVANKIRKTSRTRD